MRNKVIMVLMVLMMALSMAAAETDAVDFTASDIEGNSVTLFDYKDKIILLDFWATWCPPCRKEIPHLIDIKNTFKDSDFEIVSIALERDSEEKAIQFVKDHKMDWVHIIDNQKGRDIAKQYGVVGIPTMYVIKNGKILASDLHGNMLKAKLKELLQ